MLDISSFVHLSLLFSIKTTILGIYWYWHCTVTTFGRSTLHTGNRREISTDCGKSRLLLYVDWVGKSLIWITTVIILQGVSRCIKVVLFFKLDLLGLKKDPERYLCRSFFFLTVFFFNSQRYCSPRNDNRGNLALSKHGNGYTTAKDSTFCHHLPSALKIVRTGGRHNATLSTEKHGLCLDQLPKPPVVPIIPVLTIANCWLRF